MSSFRFSALGAAMMALTAVSGAATAATLTEPPDLPNGTNLTTNPLLTLDAGANTVSGGLAGDCVVSSFTSPKTDCNSSGGGLNDGQDSFVIEVLSGFQLVEAVLTTANVSGPDGYRPLLVFRNEDLSTLLQPAVVANGSTGDFLSGPVGAGVYSVTIYAGSANEVGLFNTDYSFSFTTEGQVNVVPLPAGLPLLAGSLGLAGLLGWRRRKS